jgi:hypothetical protein
LAETIETSITPGEKLDSTANACAEIERLHHINTEFGVIR